jgi:hypothetical protein
MGVMIESNLVEGRQTFRPGDKLVYGQSITDPCLGLKDSAVILNLLADVVRQAQSSAVADMRSSPRGGERRIDCLRNDRRSSERRSLGMQEEPVMETLTLKAETSRLLDLVVHSLYTDRDIFLRELVANASDALDRLRVEALLTPTLCDDGAPLEIRLISDPIAHTLTILDNGIGMRRDEVIDHIGTIARSGTKEFEADQRAQGRCDRAVDLIGRFGVGFYSSFMVADRVTLVTRRAGQERGTRWESSGDIHYTLEDVDAPRGSAVTLQLKSTDVDAGLEDYTDRWVITRVIKRYAELINDRGCGIRSVSPIEGLYAE